MIIGRMGYNSQNDRYGLLVMDLWEIEGFHCGDTLEVWNSEKEQWIPTRMEMHWTMVNKVDRRREKNQKSSSN